MLAVFVSIIGMGLSIYLTLHHLEVKASGATNAACNINQTFNCDEVAKSQYSEFFGIPLGVLGFGYFLAMFALAGISLINSNQRKEHMHAYIVMAVIGVATSAVLGGLSAFSLGAFCVVCIGVYVVTIFQGALVFSFRKEIPSGFSVGTLVNGGTTALIAVAVVVFAFNVLRPKVGTTTADGKLKESVATMEPFAPTVQEIPINKSAYSGLGEDYRFGSDTAKVVIIEFADFECPACARMSEFMRTLKKDYGQKILLVYRHYPLDQSCNPGITHPMHKNSCLLSTLARCAGQFNKFWDFHDLAFDNQKDASAEKAKEWAKTVGLTDEQINICLQDKSIVEKLRDDIQVANTAGLSGTPTVFVNGRKYVGEKGIVDLRQEIDRILAAN
jgi:protein-disulfide isomerase/uncharacterized membrane protein